MSHGTFEEAGQGIIGIRLETQVNAPGLDAESLQQHAQGAKTNCPVSKALAAVPITIDARMEG